ncbi:DUF4783 domain-containing protein [Bacteroidota bacterium]
MRQRRLLFLLFFSFLFLVFTQAQVKIPNEVSEAIKIGNESKLCEIFNDPVEMTVIDKENVYSKSQARQILKEFFTTYPPRKYTLIHTGGKENSRYGIAEYKGGDSNFRITFYLKKSNDNLLIHQFRIEYDNNQ